MTTSAAIGPLSFPTLSGVESRQTTQASPQLGGRSDWTKHAMSFIPPSSRVRRHGVPCWTYNGTSWLYPVPFSQTWIGREPCSPTRPYLGTSSVTTGQPQGIGGAMETEGTGQTPAVSMVTTGAPCTTTNQGPAQAGARPSPQ